MSPTRLWITSLLLLSAGSFLSRTDAFVPGAQIRPTMMNPSFSSSLWAKKKRRRKNPSPPQKSNDLPDFDLKEDIKAEVEEPSPKPSQSVSSSDDEITANMMGSADKPVRSVKELIADRALESKFEFDAPEDDSLPDLAKIAQSKQSPPQPAVGGKRARQEARKAAAKAREQEENEESIFSKIPFITDENGKVTPLKVLEAGTWLGIFILVAWEIYINSPLFERVAPMAPIVY